MNMNLVVSEGADGQLFLSGGSQNVLEYVDGSLNVSTEKKDTFKANIDFRRLFCEARKIPYAHIVCPDKHSVLKEEAPFDIKVPVGQMFHEWCKESFIFDLKIYRQQPGKGYWKTDTHWNLYGQIAFVAQVLGAFAIAEGEKEAAFAKVLSDARMNEHFCGDLGSKLEPKVYEAGLVFRRPKETIFLSNNVSGSNGTIIIVLNKNAPRRRLFICGDSFAIHSLPILSFFFDEILLIRTPYFHSEMLDSARPDFVLTENVERYLPSMPSDRGAPLGVLLPRLLGKVEQFDQDFVSSLNALLQTHSQNYTAFRRKHFG